MYVYQHHFIAANGSRLALNRFRGQPLFLVNIATGSRYTPQLSKLQAIWENYRHFGLVVIGLPCRDFGDAEPLKDPEIPVACRDRFGVRFPLTATQRLVGRSVTPLFAEMKEFYGRDIMPRWNFFKYLFDPRGKLIERWPHRTEPDDASVVQQIERNLRSWII